MIESGPNSTRSDTSPRKPPASRSDRLALVTGGASGIGGATAEALRDAGDRVAATFAHDHSVAEAFAARAGIPVYAWNVRDLTSCEVGVAKLQTDLGPADILVNNAGMTQDAMLHKMTAKQWQDVIDVNLGGCFNMCRVLIAGMRERGFGWIVNVKPSGPKSWSRC